MVSVQKQVICRRRFRFIDDLFNKEVLTEGRRSKGEGEGEVERDEEEEREREERRGSHWRRFVEKEKSVLR